MSGSKKILSTKIIAKSEEIVKGRGCILSENRCSYFAIIPHDILADGTLSPNAKLLYGEVSALISAEGFCWSGNKHFADLLGISIKSASRLISQLVEKKYLYVEVERNEKNEVTKRKIYTRESHLQVSAPLPKNEETLSPKLSIPLPKNVEVLKEKKTHENIYPIVPKNLAEKIQDYCQGNQELTKALLDFAEMRKSMHSPLGTERTVTLLLHRLDKLSGGQDGIKVQMLEEAMLHGWKTVYAPKDKPVTAPPERKEREVEWL
jgi:hypothetical protein